MLRTNSQLCTILQKTKQTVLEFYNGTAKVFWILWIFECKHVNVKLSDSQPNKLKGALKNQTGVNE